MTGRLVLVLAAIAVSVGFYSLGGMLADTLRGTSAPSGSVQARVRSALDEPDAILRTAELADALGELRPEDLPGVVEVYEERLDLLPPNRSAIDLLGEAWASVDAEAAIERIQEWPEAPRRTGLSAVTRAWARRAPNAAFVWADSLVLEDRKAAIDAVFAGWASADDPDIWKFLANLTPGFDRESATNIVEKTVVQMHGFDELFERIDALESPFEPGSPRDFKLSALRTAIGLCAFHDPDKALAYARRYAGGPYDRGLLRRLAIYWAVNDGPRAMAALLDLPSEPQRDKAIRDGYMKWLRSDGEAALGWMPAEAAHDERYVPLLALYTMGLAQSQADDPLDPIRQALDWVDRIADPRLRRDASILIGRLWIREQPDEARSWSEARGILEEVEFAPAHRRSREDAPRELSPREVESTPAGAPAEE